NKDEEGEWDFEIGDEGDGKFGGGELAEGGEAIAEALGRIAGDAAGQAAVDQQPAEGDDKGLKPQLGNQEAVTEADEGGQGQDGGEGARHGPLLIDHQPGEKHADEGDDGADGEVDTSGGDDESRADAEDAEEGGSADEVGGVVCGQELPIEDSGDNADDDEE